MQGRSSSPNSKPLPQIAPPKRAHMATNGISQISSPRSPFRQFAGPASWKLPDSKPILQRGRQQHCPPSSDRPPGPKEGRGYFLPGVYRDLLSGLTIIALFPDQFDQETSLYRIRVIISFDIYESWDIDPVVGGMNVLKVASESVTR